MEKNVSERLIVRYLANEATSEEVDQVEEWLKAHPENRKIMKEWALVWKAVYDPKISFDEKRGLELLNAQLDDPPVFALRAWHKRTSTTFYRLRVAAAVIILTGAAFLIYHHLDKMGLSKEGLMVEMMNPMGQKSTFQLSDGSLVKLNAGSQLRFSKKFSANERAVYLTGEAYFEVVRDEGRPFKVISGNLTTEVLGTSFGIRAFPNAAESQVVVATGKVQVSGTTKGVTPVVLQSQEKLVYQKRDATMTRSNVAAARELAWKDDILLFDETPLGEVTQILEQWYGVEVKLENQNLNHCTLTGRFENESLSHVLEAIRYGMGIEIERTENRINMTGIGCKP